MGNFIIGKKLQFARCVMDVVRLFNETKVFPQKFLSGPQVKAGEVGVDDSKPAA